MDNLTIEQAELINNSSPALQLVKLGTRLKAVEEGGGGGERTYANGEEVILKASLGFDFATGIVTGGTSGDYAELIDDITKLPFDFSQAGLIITEAIILNMGGGSSLYHELRKGNNGSTWVSGSDFTYLGTTGGPSPGGVAPYYWKNSFSVNPVYKNDLGIGLRLGSTGTYGAIAELKCRIVQGL